jgi:hypothetical protein
MEVQWNNIKKFMVDVVSDLIGKVEKRGKKPYITGGMMGKTDERGKWKNVNNEGGRENYRRLKNGVKRTQTRPRRNTLRTYFKRSWNLKE